MFPCTQVSPQFPNRIENDENLSALLGPRKKSRGRRKRQDDLQSTLKESSSNKHAFTVLQFHCEKQMSRSNCKEAGDSKEVSCRRSQRLRLKELKMNHFLFQTPRVTTPVNKEEEIVLAYETPDQELIMLARRRQSKTKR